MAIFKSCFGLKLRCNSFRTESLNCEVGSENTSCLRIPKHEGGKKKRKVITCENGGVARKFRWDEMERLTGNFTNRVIGSGGSSTVYLANLSPSQLCAIKVHIGSERLYQLFKQELDVMLQLRHENIVKLLGYCDDREEGIMVLEYVSNGNLHEHLHGGRRNSVLPWRARVKIAFQLAQAIEYLHESCKPHIVHGDMKASNVLLDENLNCKLCDFGSAKVGFSSALLPQSSPTSCSSPARKRQILVGSVGYTDPSYIRTGIASKKNDMYSYGVILLQLVTGAEAFCPQTGQMLTNSMAPLLKKLGAGQVKAAVVEEIMDPRLMQAGDYDIDLVTALLSISRLCLHPSLAQRPTASHVLQTLSEKIQTSYLFSPTGNKYAFQNEGAKVNRSIPTLIP